MGNKGREIKIYDAVDERGETRKHLDARFSHFGAAQQPVHWPRQVAGARLTSRPSINPHLSVLPEPYELLHMKLQRSQFRPFAMKQTYGSPPSFDM